MTKVYYDHQIFAMQQYGGISRYFYELARRVNVAADFTAKVVAPLYVNQYLKAGAVPFTGVAAPQIRNTGALVKGINRFISGGVFLAKRPDLVHCTYYGSPPRRGLPMVLTVYDMIHERYPESFAAGDTTSAKKKAAVAAADHVICISDSTRRDLIEILGTSSRKLSTIYLGFDVGSDSTQRIEPVSASSSSTPYFLYVGSRAGYKNFAGLLSAYASSPALVNGTRLLAFGGGQFDAGELELMKRLGLEPEKQVIHRSGSDEELTACYLGALAFVYPSLYEGFGIPPLEAMNCDCPVLCSNTSSLPEVVGSAALTFDPSNGAEMMAAMEAVASSPTERQRLVEAGRLRLRHFSWDRCAAETMQVYKELVTQ